MHLNLCVHFRQGLWRPLLWALSSVWLLEVVRPPVTTTAKHPSFVSCKWQRGAAWLRGFGPVSLLKLWLTRVLTRADQSFLCDGSQASFNLILVSNGYERLTGNPAKYYQTGPPLGNHSKEEIVKESENKAAISLTAGLSGRWSWGVVLGSTRAAWLPEESALQINTGICLSHCPADIPHTQQAYLLPKCKKHDLFFSFHVPTCGNRGLSVIFLCIQSLCPRRGRCTSGLRGQHIWSGGFDCTTGQKATQNASCCRRHASPSAWHSMSNLP